MKKIKFALLASALSASLLLAACGGNAASSVPAPASTASAASNLVLKVGASPAPHAEILEQVKPVLAQQGITLEIVEFNDYIIPNTALEDGDLDANYFQHQPYLDDFNAKNDTHLVTAAAIHIEPLGIYPGKTQTLEELAEGALIGIPNDTTNESRALRLLEAEGLITLKEGVGNEAVPADIVQNPHKLKFLELEASTLPVSLPDVDFAVINGNYAVGAGIGNTALATEGGESPYVNVIAIREGNENRLEIKALVAALQTEEVRNFIVEKYDGVVVPVF
ncbi:MetQ/NlpA family ABC transporter substrate-binding protein [Ruminococcaceae bacterium OttesenSCG-928-A16]|nr:MetQ/NlpA family ABC transporter substrate-binding protein [Ruminococcaceae bacterium OttesenSCG-928-A16]